MGEGKENVVELVVSDPTGVVTVFEGVVEGKSMVLKSTCVGLVCFIFYFLFVFVCFICFTVFYFFSFLFFSFLFFSFLFFSFLFFISFFSNPLQNKPDLHSQIRHRNRPPIQNRPRHLPPHLLCFHGSCWTPPHPPPLWVSLSISPHSPRYS